MLSGACGAGNVNRGWRIGEETILSVKGEVLSVKWRWRRVAFGARIGDRGWRIGEVIVGTTRALSENGEHADYQTTASCGQGTPCPYNNKEPQIKQINRIL